jgi:hypothetical protein
MHFGRLDLLLYFVCSAHVLLCSLQFVSELPVNILEFVEFGIGLIVFVEFIRIGEFCCLCYDSHGG